MENPAGQNDLVFDLVIRSLKSTHDVRRCRFVCKSWNDSACAVLRQTTSVTINECDEEKVARFKRLQRARKKSEDLRLLPNPFRKIELIADSFSERGFINFIRRWDTNLVVTSIGVLFGWAPVKRNYSILQDLLISWGETTLESLAFYWSDFKPKPKEFNLEKIKLASLKHLRISVEVSSSNLFKTILRHSKLQYLILRLTEPLPLDLGSVNFDNVSSIDVENSCFRDFTKLSLHNVKYLHIRALENTYPIDVAQFVSKCSTALEYLRIDGVDVPTYILPKFPNLKKIYFEHPILELDPVKFPRLNGLTFSASPGFKSGLHNEVQKLCYVLTDYSEENEHDGDMNPKPDFRTFIMKLGRWFPNVEHFQTYRYSEGRFLEIFDPQSTEILATIRESFPHLKTLEINSKQVELL